ncbi:MAG: hypothetical protein AAGH46_05040, partial [Bacteroidota bacterium]
LNCFRLSARFEEVILFMDCCRDMGQPIYNPHWPIECKPDRAARKVKTAVGLGAELFSKAREKKLKGKIQGIFSNSLMDGLEGRAADRSGNITGASLTSYLYSVLSGDQRPDLNLDPTIIFAQGFAPVIRSVPISLVGGTVQVDILDGQNGKVIISQKTGTDQSQIHVQLPAYQLYILVYIDSEGNIISEDSLAVENNS